MDIRNLREFTDALEESKKSRNALKSIFALGNSDYFFDLMERVIIDSEEIEVIIEDLHEYYDDSIEL